MPDLLAAQFQACCECGGGGVKGQAKAAYEELVFDSRLFKLFSDFAINPVASKGFHASSL